MYNRYTPKDYGSYHHPPNDPPHRNHAHPPHHLPPRRGPDLSGLLSGVADKLKLDEIDTGDLLLLVLLFLLFREGEDEELLIALGLLLIL